MRIVPPGEVDIKSALDPLEELLAIDPNKEIFDEVDMEPWFRGKWKVRALTNTLNADFIGESYLLQGKSPY